MPFITDRLEFLQNANDSLKDSPQKQEKEHTAVSSQKTFVSRFTFEIQAVMAYLKAHIIGQDKALKSIEKILKIVKAELSDPQRPLAVALLLGPTGVGKTSTAKLLAQALDKKQTNFCRIDMNTLAQEHYAASLIGAPPGYVGSKEGNTLFDTQSIAGTYSCPSVVLFDEIEKASKEVLLSLLDVLDSGELMLTSGTKKIDFKNAIILMTSNLGAKELFAYRKRHKKSNALKEQKIIKKKLEQTFLPEFINRIDYILYYSSIDKKQLSQIIELELEALQAKTSGRIILSKKARKALKDAYHFTYGVRDIKRLFANEILPLAAERILNKQSVCIISKQQGNFVVQ